MCYTRLMRKSRSGFTIVELLIVVVVIALLATIATVAYTGMQARARDNIRYADVKAIMNALELYKADHGSYPPTTPTTTAGVPAGSTGCTANGYSFSWATDGRWMKPLVDEGYMTAVPTPPGGSCTNVYRYLRREATAYGCTTRTSDWYVLIVDGTDEAFTPSDESSSETESWKPCPEAINASWGYGKSRWAFAKDDI